MNQDPKKAINPIIFLSFAIMLFVAAFFYSAKIEKETKLPVETGRVPVTNSSGLNHETATLAVLL